MVAFKRAIQRQTAVFEAECLNHTVSINDLWRSV